MRQAIPQPVAQGSNPAVASPPMQHAPAQQDAPVQAKLNIGILDSKDFPSEVAPIQELYTDIAMMQDGHVLFACKELLKSTGIDLMNCPLTVQLMLRVCRRMPQGSHVLWHVVLPLPVIGKNLMSPPHVWETWIGLMPNKQSLTDHPAEVMFTQAVHLISRPEFPKLRLRFTYHNPQLQAQAQAQQAREEQEAQRRKVQTEQMGLAQFQDIHKLMQTVRESSGSNPSANAAKAAAAMETPPPHNRARGPEDDALRDTYPVAVTVPTPESSQAHVQQQQAGYGGAHVNTQMVAPPQYTAPANAVASPPSEDDAVVQLRRQVEDLSMRARVVAEEKSHLEQSLRAAHQQELANLRHAADSERTRREAEIKDALAKMTARAENAERSNQELQVAMSTSKPSCSNSEAEPLLVEGVRMAIMGLLDDSDTAAGQVPRTSTNLSAASEHTASIKKQFPNLWNAFREVSALAKERASHLEQQHRLKERCQYLEEQRNKLNKELSEQASKENQADPASKAEAKNHFEKLLKQQREALQMNFDAETKSLRHQLEEMKSAAQTKETEVAQLRSQLSKFLQSRKG